MTAGTIKKVVADRGFGFITSSDQKDYFFHRSSLDSSLNGCGTSTATLTAAEEVS